jgi:hypothetical protein
MLKDEIKKRNQLKNIKKQIELICQTHDLGFQIKITS